MTRQAVNNQRLFCPNSTCVFHQPYELRPAPVPSATSRALKTRKFHRHGSYQARNSEKKFVDRFLCLGCGKTFSRRINSIEFGLKKRGLSSRVFKYFCEGLCNRQIARLIGIDESTVRIRLKRLSEQSLLQHAKRTKDQNIEEPVCYDGLENFALSQYEPNNINQAIGRDSLFIYDFNFCPLNRKGRMSDRQKLKKAVLEKRMGMFRQDATCLASTWIFKRLLNQAKQKGALLLLSDQHYQYRQSKALLRAEGLKFEHLTISSKAPRIYRHILFPVNHADLLIRQHVKAFQRETISFSKTHGYMAQKFALFTVWKNYFRPQFTKKQKLNPKSNTQSPAMALGLALRLPRFQDFFKTRYLPTQIKLSQDWEYFYKGLVPDFRIKGVQAMA